MLGERLLVVNTIDFMSLKSISEKSVFMLDEADEVIQDNICKEIKKGATLNGLVALRRERVYLFTATLSESNKTLINTAIDCRIEVVEA